MHVFTSPSTQARQAATELAGGEPIAPWECSARVDMILTALAEGGHGPFLRPGNHGLTPAQAIHTADYVTFLENAWADWQAAGYTD